MANLNLLLFASISLSVTIALSSGSDRHKIQTRGARDRYCGKNLVSALQLACEGVGYNGERLKRSVQTSEQMKRFANRDNGLGWLYLKGGQQPIDSPPAANEKAYTLAGPGISADLGFFARHLRGAHDDCCRNPCSLQEMRLYCNPSKRYGPDNDLDWL